MNRSSTLWSDARTHLVATRPDHPVLYFSPARMRATAAMFLDTFPGLVSYAIKANDDPGIVENLLAAGIAAFDVASPAEMAQVRALSRDAALHYNNPVRSVPEIETALGMRVRSWSVDDPGEFAKLARRVPQGAEISVRFKAEVRGGYYDFGAKFGAPPELAADLLLRVVEAGYRPSMTFHPGTQCETPGAWTAYITAAADIARAAGIAIDRLNVGGGFPGHRTGAAPDLPQFFRTIAEAAESAFAGAVPVLVCEPGRAMVAEGYALAARVKSRRGDGRVFLNDGIYGGMAEAALTGSVDRITVLSPDGTEKGGPTFDAVVFGPTCDSLDRIKGTVALPETLAEDDYVLFDGMGGYSTSTATRFNGYGDFETVTLADESDIRAR